MTNENKTILIKRFKSLVWRMFGIAAVMFLNFLAEIIGLFELSNGVVIVVGLIVGEITKYIAVNRKEIQPKVE